MAGKSRSKLSSPVPQPHGGALVAGAGRGPTRGAWNAGRPPEVWRRALQELASRDEVIEHLTAVIVAGPAHPAFRWVLEYVTEHGMTGQTLENRLLMTLSLLPLDVLTNLIEEQDPDRFAAELARHVGRGDAMRLLDRDIEN